MKSLKFNHIEAENIKKGVQTATLRIRDEKGISVDDTIAIIDKVKEEDPSSWVIIGEARVDKVTMQRAGDLDLNGADFEQFGSTTELYEQLALFYGDPIDKLTHVKVINFIFKPFGEPKKLNNTDVEGTTKISEIKLFGDGGSRGNPGPSASGFVIMDMQDNVIETNGEYLNITTNNQAEYHSLRLGLERARQLGVEIVHVHMDSMLVVNQMKGVFKVKNKELLGVYKIVAGMLKDFKKVDFTHVPRELNKLADGEVNRILDSHKNMV
jgi:ribonuclease HI